MGFWFKVMFSLIVILVDDLIEHLFYFHIAFPDFLLKVVIGIPFLLKGEEVVFPAIGLQRFCDLLISVCI